MESADAKLRVLYRLAERVEGAQLDVVMARIKLRRRELEATGPSEVWDVPEVEPSVAWSPPRRGFHPGEGVPVYARRAGERGFRVVGLESPSSRS